MPSSRPARAGLLGLLWLLGSATACTVTGSRPALSGAFATPETAAEAVLLGVWQKDTAQLTAIAVGEHEFRDLVWPRLPASRPEVGMPVEYLWTDQRTKSLAHLGRLLARHGGTRFTFVSLGFRGAVSDYGTFRIHRETWLALRDASGTRHELRWFGSMIESPDGWKIYSYIID
jgi:hypothetical protein